MSESSPVDRALDVVVYAPLGVALFARDALPGIAGMFIARGRSEIEQRRKHVEQQVTQAKTIGRFAVRFGAPEVKRRVGDGVATARATAESTLGSLAGTRDAAPVAPTSRPSRGEPAVRKAPRDTPAATNGHQAGAARTAEPATPDVPAPPVSELPIPDYDELSASQVVGRLEGLSDTDLETVRAYETAHRNRRTILGKIAQLNR